MKTTHKSLQKYREGRNFELTSEPPGNGSNATSRSSAAASRRRSAFSFVVQKHDASRLHYDFRLEINGVLVSWAVPKGPSLDPSARRLAVHVEDHPLEYGTFEGTIPKGEYGAGEVIVWDCGKWFAIEPENPADFERNGVLKFELQGQKLKGKWNLVRFRTDDKNDNWLLVKENDQHAKPGSDDEIVRKHPNSVFTGKPLKLKGRKTSDERGAYHS